MPILLPCCYDGLTARLVARAGFEATFMTGFGVSAVNGYPDTQLVSYAEMQSAASTVAEGLSSAALELGQEPIPCIADGDTGYGNAVNVKRVSAATPWSTTIQIMMIVDVKSYIVVLSSTKRLSSDMLGLAWQGS